jgi:hydroxymethylbilane synthase|tara:strand:- start:324 stop:863 length:540 start_codon:yes stop_codon:yes gene_type:complete
VATGSIRRRAHLSHLRPDLAFSGLRGNIETRLSKAEGFDAVVVAAAALDRLGLVPDIVDRLDPTVLLPQVAQGALAVECRSGDVDVGEVLKAVEDPVARRAVDAERAFLAELGAGCDLPIAAHAVLDGDEVVLIGALSSSDGSVLVREQRQSVDGERLGRAVARHLLDDRGGIELMEAG